MSWAIPEKKKTLRRNFCEETTGIFWFFTLPLEINPGNSIKGPWKF